MENIIKDFKIYIETNFEVSSVSKKNYLVDLKNFLEWFVLCLNSQESQVDFNSSNLLSYFTSDKVIQYKDFLYQTNTPSKTIKRRLSTLRKLGSFAVSKSYIKTNPMSFLNDKDQKQLSDEKLVNEFKNDLLAENISRVSVKNYLVDIRQFLEFVKFVSVLLIILLPSATILKIYIFGGNQWLLNHIG